MDKCTPTCPADPEHDETLRSTGSKYTMPDAKASKDTVETMSPIERTYWIPTEHFSEEEMHLVIQMVMEIVKQLDKEKQKDEKTREQRLNEVRAAMDAVLKKLRDSPTKGPTLAFNTSDTVQLLSSNLTKQRANLPAVLELPTLLRTGIDTAVFRKLYLQLSVILKTHWEASRHFDSIQTAQYPWLSCIMASGYCLAFAYWLGSFATDAYKLYVVSLHLHVQMYRVVIALLSRYLDLVVAYTMALGNPFVSFVVLLIWAVLRACLKID